MNKIYVGNLPFRTTEQEVEESFAQFGEIEELVLIRDRFTNNLKGFGFITFVSPDSAKEALVMDGKDFAGRPLRVNIAREREKNDGDRGDRGDRDNRW